MEIHHIGVSQGDSTLIVVRDLPVLKASLEKYALNKGLTVPAEEIDYLPFAVHYNMPLNGTVKKAVLIDGGVDEMGSSVVDYLITYGVLPEITTTFQPPISVPRLTVMVTHMHDDHYQGLRCLLWRLNPDYLSKKLKNRAIVPRLLPFYIPAEIYLPADTNKEGVLGLGFRKEIKDLAAKYPTHFKIKSYADLLFDLGLDKLAKPKPITLETDPVSPIKMLCVAADGMVCDPTKTKRLANPKKESDLNAFSSTFVLEYGSFRYFLGGDLAGNTGVVTKKKIGSYHLDMETDVSKALTIYFKGTAVFAPNSHKFPNDGYCTGFKANHHSSASSNSNKLLCAMRPCFAAISSGFYNRFHGHPTNSNMERFSAAKTPAWDTIPNSIQKFFITEIAKKHNKKNTDLSVAAEGRILGDIVVRPVDESIENIYKAGAKGTNLEVQIYGSGILTYGDYVKEKEAELFDAFNDTTQSPWYEKGYFKLSDKH